MRRTLVSTEQLPRRVILRILEAVNDIGVSHDAIAKELTADAVPSPSGGTGWDASTIRAVLASKAAADARAPRKPATSTVEHFDDPASAPFGASTAITATDPDGGVGISYTNAAGDWVGCVIGVALPPDETEIEPVKLSPISPDEERPPAPDRFIWRPDDIVIDRPAPAGRPKQGT